MGKVINVSDKAYEWLLKEAGKNQGKSGEKVSIADVVDELIKRGG